MTARARWQLKKTAVTLQTIAAQGRWQHDSKSVWQPLLSSIIM